MFDPTWFDGRPVDLAERLRLQLEHKDSDRLRVATEAYLLFLEQGGQLRFEELTTALVRKYLSREIPILTGLSATYLYRNAREFGPEGRSDDIRGKPAGHFVVLCGYDKETREVLVADPLLKNPLSGTNHYVVSIDRVICAILLGILTYDANLLIIEPRQKRKHREAVPILIVVNNVKEWPFHIPGVEVVDAWSYLTRARVRGDAGGQALQSVPLVPLSDGRVLRHAAGDGAGHKPLPSITTIQDMKSQTMVRFVSDDLDDLIQHTLAPIQSDEFTLSVYFGRNLAQQLRPAEPAPVQPVSGAAVAGRVRADNGKLATQELEPDAGRRDSRAAPAVRDSRGDRVFRRPAC